ncbi:MAG TPA: glycosyltransferase [Thermoleophilaceae bacterium]|jgi:glycosyltransferase involved in cell wall biosynthesis
MTDVVFTFDAISWDAVKRRGMCFPEDRLAEALIGSPEVRRVLISNPPRSLPVKLVKDRLRRRHPFPASDRARLHEPLRLRRRDPAGIGGLERAYRAYERSLRRAAADMGLERPAVITAQPLLAGFADFDWAGSVTLYATDDWAVHPDFERWQGGFEEAYARVSRKGVRVCAVTQAILDRIDPTAPSAVVPNGIDPDEWTEPGPAPGWFERLPAPRLLYVGSLQSRVDVHAVRRAGESLDEGSLVLVGPLLDPEHFFPLGGAPHVHLQPGVERHEVPALMTAADVGLVPHVKSPLTLAMSPLKLYEYLAAGCPVAATDLPPLRGVDDRVIISNGDFAAATSRALSLGRASESERKRFISENAWSRRTAQVLELALDPRPSA